MEEGQRKKQRTSCEEPTERSEGSTEERCRRVYETLRQRSSSESEVEEALNVLTAVVDTVTPPPPPAFRSCLESTLEWMEPGKCGELAVEVWSVLAERERDLILDGAGTIGLVANSLEKLIPCLFRTLLHQERNSEWNVATGAGACLSVVAELVEDQIIPFVYSFVKDHINSEDWRQREAALMAFGATTSGPTAQTLQRHFRLLLPDVLERVKDMNEDIMVRDSACWSLGQVCVAGHLEEDGKLLSSIHAALLGVVEELKEWGSKGSTDTDNRELCSKACWSLAMMAENTQLLSPEKAKPFLKPTLEILLQTLNSRLTKRGKNKDNTAVITEAINFWLRGASADLSLIDHTFDQLLRLLESLVKITADDHPERTEEEGDDDLISSAALCSCIWTCMEAQATLPSERTRKLVDVLLIAAKFEKTEQRSFFSEELLLCFGGLAARIEGEMENFMPDIVPLVEEALRGNDPTVPQSTVTTALAVVGDLARALNRNISPFLDRLLVPMLVILKSPASRRLHPGALGAISDLALTSCDNFSKYLPTILTTLKDTCNEATSLAASLAANDDLSSLSDSEDLSYLNNLRQSIFECYTGIIQGYRNNGRDSAKQQLTPYLNGLVRFICQLSEDATQTETVTQAAIGVLGDLVQLIGETARQMFRSDATLMSYLKDHADSEEEDLKRIASWAVKVCS
ncbi:Importin subunit beta-1, variant 2 [Balamuthia mandrillaris]